MSTEQNITKVKKLKLKNGFGLVLTYEKKSIGDKVDGNEKHDALIHSDLLNGIDSLAIHLAIMTGYVKPAQVEDIAMPSPELSATFHVNGYSLGGNDDNQGIVVSGHHIVPGSGLAVILNTPFRRFDENLATRYPFMDDLQARIRVIESEIEQYLAGTKRGEPIQAELDLKDPAAADPDAMNRVKDDGAADGKEEKTKRKRVAQSADAPSGEAVV